MIIMVASYLVITEIDYLTARRYFGDCVRLLGHWSELNVELLSADDVVVYYTGDVDEGALPLDFENRVRQHSAVVLGLEPSFELPAQTLHLGPSSGYYRTSSIQNCSQICRLILAAQPGLMRHYRAQQGKLPYWLPDLCAPT